MQIKARAQFVRIAEDYNGLPQMIFRDPDKSMWNEFSVTYQKGAFASPLDPNTPKWYLFRADEYKYRSTLREFLGECYDG